MAGCHVQQRPPSAPNMPASSANPKQSAARKSAFCGGAAVCAALSVLAASCVLTMRVYTQERHGGGGGGGGHGASSLGASPGAGRRRAPAPAPVAAVAAVAALATDGARGPGGGVPWPPPPPPLYPGRACPDTAYTEVRGRPKNLKVRCICPETFVCTQCEPGCMVQPRPHWKPRCASGYSANCTDCGCSAPGTPGHKPSGASDLGAMEDRRSAPFCTNVVRSNETYKGKFTFVFVVSNGHTGTTFLGQMGVWRTYLGKGRFLPPGFSVAHESEVDKEALVKIPFRGDFCERAARYVAERKVPRIASLLQNRKQHTYVASGHQIVLGIIPALADVLGKQARFVRMRRNRLDVAYSYAQKLDGPCAIGCKYCICPMDPLARCPVSAAIWERLSVYQQFLWFVDELECQWQAVRRERPGLIVDELNWDRKIGPDHLLQVASFAGMDTQLKPGLESAKKANQHLSNKTRSAKNYTWMGEQSHEYQQLLGLKHCGTYHCIPDLR